MTRDREPRRTFFARPIRRFDPDKPGKSLVDRRDDATRRMNGESGKLDVLLCSTASLVRWSILIERCTYANQVSLSPLSLDNIDFPSVRWKFNFVSMSLSSFLSVFRSTFEISVARCRYKIEKFLRKCAAELIVAAMIFHLIFHFFPRDQIATSLLLPAERSSKASVDASRVSSVLVSSIHRLLPSNLVVSAVATPCRAHF